MKEDGADFGAAEDYGQAFRFLGEDEAFGRVEVDQEDFAIEEEESAGGLVLGRGGDFANQSEVGEEGAYFGRAHLGRVLFVVEEDVTFDPLEISFFGAKRIVENAKAIASRFEKL